METEVHFERGLTFEKAWAFMQETNRQLRESKQETDRQLQELAAQIKETNQQMKETDKKIGRLGNRIGELVEHLMAADIVNQFNTFGYVFTHAARRSVYQDLNGKVLAKVDILLENEEYVLAVEVKTELKVEDIQDHCKRLEVVRWYADERKDPRKYLGGVASGISSEQASDYALKRGLYVIEFSGKTVNIKAPEQVRTW